jgi:hypothetical protein
MRVSRGRGTAIQLESARPDDGPDPSPCPPQPRRLARASESPTFAGPAHVPGPGVIGSPLHYPERLKGFSGYRDRLGDIAGY